MTTVVEAQEGDTLCTIAIAHGFANCDRLRDEGANSDLLDRPLRDGDRVTVPDIEEDQEDRPNEDRHPFRRRGVPPPAIRFIHGTRTGLYRDDPDLDHLNISNLVADKSGANGQRAFSTAFGFEEHTDADEDTFKIEVVEPNAGGNTVTIDLEAVHAVDQPDGSVEWQVVGNPNAAMRSIKVACDPVTASNNVRLRSRYMKLVTDEADMAALSGNPPRGDGTAQALMTSDTADGNDGDADALEILDQQVRATHVVAGCNAADPDKCKMVAQVPIGPRRRRIKLAMNVFRLTAGGTAVGNATEQMMRLRTMKWFRRAYAQAELAPKLVDHEVRFVDPPPANMLVISNDDGNVASGNNAAGRPSTLRFSLSRPGHIGRAPRVQINPAAGMTPAQAAAAIATALPAGYSAQATQNARGFSAADSSWDVIITHSSGSRVTIRRDSCDDLTMDLLISRVNTQQVDNSHPNDSLIAGAYEMRHLIRSFPGADDRLDCYIVNRFNSFGLRGRAFILAQDLAATYQPPPPLRWACMMGMTSSSGAVMDAGDNLPFTYPHEAGHALNDAFHSDHNGDPLGSSELMGGGGTSATNTITATKRICDTVHVRYGVFNPAQASPGDSMWDTFSAVDRFRTRGAPVTEGW